VTASEHDGSAPDLHYVVNEPPDEAAFLALWHDAWGTPWPEGRSLRFLERSLCYLLAYDGAAPVGFVNVAWDGGVHASIFDTIVAPAYRRRGVGRELLRRAALEAKLRGAHYLHVDFEPQLLPFYRACGFRHTEAGLMELGERS
jgi:ribosomal protein S18 acetylase RimI-like enzyme